MGVVVRLSIDQLKQKADEKYEPVELDLPSGKVARFENLIRLDEDRQRKVLEHIDKAREDRDGEKAQRKEESFDLTRLVASTSEQIVFVQEWARLMLDEGIAVEVEDHLGRDLGLWLFVFNSWMSAEGVSGEASPSAE